jgi:hypothetical protein
MKNQLRIKVKNGIQHNACQYMSNIFSFFIQAIIRFMANDHREKHEDLGTWIHRIVTNYSQTLKNRKYIVPLFDPCKSDSPSPATDMATVTISDR